MAFVAPRGFGAVTGGDGGGKPIADGAGAATATDVIGLAGKMTAAGVTAGHGALAAEAGAGVSALGSLIASTGKASANSSTIVKARTRLMSARLFTAPTRSDDHRRRRPAR